MKHRHSRAPISITDLTTARGQDLLHKWLDTSEVIGFFLAPPCGTASRARKIKLKNMYTRGPVPLRSDESPNGLGNLVFVDRIKVSQANKLYHLTAQLVKLALDRKMVVCVENLQFFHFWATSLWIEVAGTLQYTIFHSCQVGSARLKKTMLAHNHEAFQRETSSCIAGDHRQKRICNFRRNGIPV